MPSTNFKRRGGSQQNPIYGLTPLTDFVIGVISGLTKKAEPPPTRDVNRDSGTDSANGGWLRRLVRRHGHNYLGNLPSIKNCLS